MPKGKKRHPREMLTDELAATCSTPSVLKHAKRVVREVSKSQKKN